MSKPHCIFFESSCGAKTFDRAFVVFGAEMALGAVFIYDVKETDGHCDAGYSGAETPVVFHAVCLVVSEGHEIHVTLLDINQSVERKVVYALTPIELQTLHMQLQFYLLSV